MCVDVNTGLVMIQSSSRRREGANYKKGNAQDSHLFAQLGAHNKSIHQNCREEMLSSQYPYACKGVFKLQAINTQKETNPVMPKIAISLHSWVIFQIPTQIAQLVRWQ